MKADISSVPSPYGLTGVLASMYRALMDLFSRRLSTGSMETVLRGVNVVMLFMMAAVLAEIVWK